MGKSITGTRLRLIGWAVLASVLVLTGCEEEEGVRPDINRPPETSLAVAPRPGSEVFHKYRVNWTGIDRDGVVERYRIVSMPEEELYSGLVNPEDIEAFLFDILFDPDNPGSTWFETDTTESLFVFRADSPNSRKHSLYISAIDNEGKLDLSPAATNFMAIDYSLPQMQLYFSSNIDTLWKESFIRGDTLPAYNEGEHVEARIRWEGYDPDGEIIEWRYRLDSGAERRLPPEQDRITFIYDPDDPLGSDVWVGFHEFKLVGIDDAMARSDEYVVRFIVNHDPDTFIDSVWAFRNSKLDTVPEVLIYPTDGEADMVWHFGLIRFKFHGYDQDKFPDTEVSPAIFTWRIKGTLVTSSPTWVAKPTGEYIDGQPVYADTVPVGREFDTDAPLQLIVRSRDELGTIDGTPSSLVFLVDYPPDIESVSWTQTGPGTVLFEWEASDPDEDVDWTPALAGALMRYRYRVDKGPWYLFGAPELDPVTRHYFKYVEVENIALGSHTFTLQAFNQQYFTTRSDEWVLEFEVGPYP